jgi:hypothetical protein
MYYHARVMVLFLRHNTATCIEPGTMRQFQFPAEMSGIHIKSTVATYDSNGRHRASALGKTNLQNWLQAGQTITMDNV